MFVKAVKANAFATQVKPVALKTQVKVHLMCAGVCEMEEPTTAVLKLHRLHLCLLLILGQKFPQGLRVRQIRLQFKGIEGQFSFIRPWGV